MLSAYLAIKINTCTVKFKCKKKERYCPTNSERFLRLLVAHDAWISITLLIRSGSAGSCGHEKAKCCCSMGNLQKMFRGKFWTFKVWESLLSLAVFTINPSKEKEINAFWLTLGLWLITFKIILMLRNSYPLPSLICWMI